MKEQTISNVKKALAEILKISDLESIQLESKLRDDLGLDSMSSLTFLIALEESIAGFNVNPDTLETNHLETVASIVDYVLQEIAKESTSTAVTANQPSFGEKVVYV